ncbi:ABC transporter C family member 10 [Aristolochia californica]|uniref:ABC transporter C family member 10 n=1 Tax=Aristolochia californica TaxID=171875 RepID=UPI0035D8F81F
MEQTFTGAWMAFCGEPSCPYDGGKTYNQGFQFVQNVMRPNSCPNHIFIVSVDIVLILMFLFQLLYKTPSRAALIPKRFQSYSLLHLLTAFTNCSLGLAYLGLSIWILGKNLSEGLVVPLHHWLVMLIHGLVWMFLCLTVCLREHQLPRTFVKLSSATVCIVACFLCATSVLAIVTKREVSLRIVVDILSLPGAILLAFCIVRGSKHAEASQTTNGALYMPLNGELSGKDEYSGDSVTPFATAGCLSTMSFWWLNSLMKKGTTKTIEEKDIPQLPKADQAECCYTLFLEQLNRPRQANQSKPSILWTLVSCHWREILVSGFFAFIKILTVSSGPILLNAFIKVAEGQAAFKYEGYLLAGGLFLAKCLESLSQRQWYFRSRMIGVRVRSLLSAAIYQKQLRLSNRARMIHSSGEIINYVTVDAYRIGEFPFWFHQTWTTSLQICITLVILYHAIGLATISALLVIILTVICNVPLAKLQHKFQTKLMEAQDKRLKATSEALLNMKILKLYAWETHFKNFIEDLRKVEYKWLSAVQLRKAYNSFLFWCSPVLVSVATFGTCYLIHIPLYASNVFTFIATLRLVQEPVRSIPEVIGVVIQAKVALARIVRFLEAPELQNEHVRKKLNVEVEHAIVIKSSDFLWEGDSSRPTLRSINLEVKPGGKVAICGEVGSGKSTLLAAILGEIPNIRGMIQVQGKLAYVSQTAWIQTGTIRENILFGGPMDQKRYQEVVEKCSLVKDLEMLPFGDLTEIGERGVNLSGGQKQRIQLARAVYQNADIYLLDDPFSAVDAHTATSLFNECIMGCLSEKTVLLVTHQVDFLPAFNSVLLMSNGVIMCAAPYAHLLASSKEFQELVNAHKETAGTERLAQVVSSQKHKAPAGEIKKVCMENQPSTLKVSTGDQLIKQEEKELGDTGLKPYLQYLKQNKGYLYFSFAVLCHLIFVAGQIMQNSWMAANVQNANVSNGRLISVYLAIGCASAVFLLLRSVFTVVLGLVSSKSLFTQLMYSLFRAPMSFYDSTPLGRILSRVSSDLSIVDLDLPFSLIFTAGSTTNAYSNLGVLAVVTWQVLFVSIPMIYLTIRLQRYYFASAKEFMRINGTTKSFIANHLAESISGSMTIRAFEEENRFFSKNLGIIDRNASPFFHGFAANEWLIQRLETMSAIVLSSSALAMALLPKGTFSSGFIGMALSYGLSMNISLVFSIQNQCTLANYIISVERLNQYMHIPSEAPEVNETNRPAHNWPTVGQVEIQDLKIRYRPDTPFVLQGITCRFGGGEKIGIVGRTGSGKTTLIGALFRLVEPAGGKIIIDGIDISTIGLHDLRSRLGVIPQDPTLFHGTVRFNLDPLSQHTDHEIWEVLQKCQLHDAVKEKEMGLDSLVTEDGSNWSMGQRQLFCLGRALLRRSKILVLDEATASVDNATDSILQKKIRTEFAECTVITVAHRIPTVMDCTMVLALSDGKIVEYDEPMKLMKRKGSLFGELVKEYWSRTADATIDSTIYQ